MKEQMIDVPITLDKETIDTFNEMSKAELIKRICSVALEMEVYKLRGQVAMEDTKRTQNENEKLQTKLDKSKTHINQCRSTIEAIMKSWHVI